MIRRNYLFPSFKSQTGIRYGRQFCHFIYRPLTTAQQNSFVSSSKENFTADYSPGGYCEKAEKAEMASSLQGDKEDETGASCSVGEGVSFQKWLNLESERKGRCLQYSKNCILSPFLFGEKMNYCDKIISWLVEGDLLPKPRHICGNLTDRNIEISDCTEDAVDIILPSMSSIDFLSDVCQVTEQLKECGSIEQALSVAAKSSLVSFISQCFSATSELTEKDFHLITVTVLNQAMKHVEQASSSTGDLIGAFEESLKSKENDCVGLRLKGNRYFRDKDYRAAIKFYTKAIKLSPFNHILYGNRAQSYHNLQQYREALSDAKRAVFLQPNWEKGHYRYAQACFELGLTEKAIALNLKAQKRCSRNEVLLKQVQHFRHSRSDGPSCDHKRKRTASSCTSDDELCCQGATSVPFPNWKLSESEGSDADDCHSFSYAESLPSLSSDTESDDSADIRSGLEDMPPLAECDSSDDSTSDDSSEDSDGESCSSHESDDEESHSDDDDDGDDDGFPMDLPFGILPNPFEVLMHSRGLLEMIQEFLQAHPEMDSDDAPSAALPEVIESLPRITVTQADVDAKTSCAICRCDYELSEQILKLPCEHIFHTPCVTTWLKMHATCPTCRDVLPH